MSSPVVGVRPSLAFQVSAQSCSAAVVIVAAHSATGPSAERHPTSSYIPRLHTRWPSLSGLTRPWLVLLLLLQLASCSSAPRINTRYQSISQDSRVRFIIIHFTQENFADSLRRLTREEVSSHYLIDADPAAIYRLVPEARRAWHAGRSAWHDEGPLNASSIGIEIVNVGNQGNPAQPYQAFAPAQIERVIELVRDIQRRHLIRADRILGHAEVQPQTRTDPGPAFPWRALADAGLVPWPDVERVSAAEAKFRTALPTIGWFQQRLRAHGFSVPSSAVLDTATRRVLAVFQMRFRPARYDGEPDAETAALLEVITTPGGLRLHSSDTAPGPGGDRPFAPQ